ncbi:MAG: dihydropyrimidinase, partial [Chloroflexi bacterium]|nr:dihydropyrimidinase [Chloroflexota bacterium]
MTDLLVLGGAVVTAAGSRRADVAATGGVIEAIEADLGGLAASAWEVGDATGLLVLPGAVDVHTHTRVATDVEPDRFFQDS